MATNRSFENMLNEKSLYRKPAKEEKNKYKSKSMFAVDDEDDDSFSESSTPAKITGKN